MYLLHEKDQSLSFQYAKWQSSFPLLYRVIEERKWQMRKKYDNVKHSYLSKNVTFSTIYL